MPFVLSYVDGMANTCIWDRSEAQWNGVPSPAVAINMHLLGAELMDDFNASNDVSIQLFQLFSRNPPLSVP